MWSSLLSFLMQKSVFGLEVKINVVLFIPSKTVVRYSFVCYNRHKRSYGIPELHNNKGKGM